MSEAPTIVREPVAAELLQPPAEKVPVGRKIAYGAGAISDQFVTNGIGSLAMPIYNLGLGLDPRLLGWIMALPRVFDAIIDPSIGNLSDNTRTRWGRRRPYILIGGVVLSVFFVAMWLAPRSLAGRTVTFALPSWLGGTMHLPHLAIYFLVTSMLCYFGYAFFSVPRGAMGIEMSTDYHERTAIFAWNTFLAYTAAFLMPWLYNLSFQAGKLAGGDEILGVRYVAAGVGVVMLVCALAPALFVRERAGTFGAQPKTPLFEGLRMTFNNYPLWLMFTIVFLVLLACSMIGPMGLYISIDYICGGDKKWASYIGGVNGVLQGAVGIAVTPLVAWTARRIGKKSTMALGQIIAIGGFAASWWLMTPRFPYLQLVKTGLVTFGLTSVWVLWGSVMADICDLDELKYGLRREGMFGAAVTFLMKASTACVTVVAGYALIWAGYRPGGMQTVATLTLMRVLYIAITVGCLLVSLALTFIFPINEKSAREVRAILDARNGRSG
ncbi:MAG: MFS transporter [bacterium]|nr:MFS transporter [bacterium]